MFNDGDGYDLLIVVLPDYSYSSEEIAVIEQWVGEGNSLLAFGERGDHFLFAESVERLNLLLENMGCQINMDESFVSVSPVPQTNEPKTADVEPDLTPEPDNPESSPKPKRKLKLRR